MLALYLVKGAAIETTELSQEFEVTAILAPTVSAPVQPVLKVISPE